MKTAALVMAACVGAVAGAASAGSAITIETVAIAGPGNPPDTTGLGTVAVRFRLGRFEVTNEQYVAFLNAVAAADPAGLFNDLMTTSDRGGIVRSGTPGAYTYVPKADFDDKPVVAVGWTDVARFCNWLHNGQPAGPQGAATTEDGAYDLALPIDAIVRKPGARWFLPTHDEWYKAAYYDPFDAGAGSPEYWLYPTRSDALPDEAMADSGGDVVNPGPDIANHSKGADWNDENGNVTTVGGCQAPSPWGAFDLGGNANEWTETLGNPIPANPPEQPDPLPTRTIRGGDFASTGVLMASPPALAPDLNMVAEGANIGFRVASPDRVPSDLDGNGAVDVTDLLAVLAAWGSCNGCPADLNGDGVVDVTDLLEALAAWG